MLVYQQKKFEKYNFVMVYVSPSILPSRSANSIHVINQCNALAKKTDSIHLYFATQDKQLDASNLNKFYGVQLHSNIELHPVYISNTFAVQLRIAFRALLSLINSRNKTVISRNFYFSFILTLFCVVHVHECHGLETQKIKKFIQNKILRRNRVVVISEKLADMISSEYALTTPPLILHDAASQVSPINVDSFIRDRSRFKIGYFGHLYPGRGIEIIRDLAEKFSFIDFYVAGGDEASINLLKDQNNPKNMIILGFLRNIEARSLMSELDALLMPYQTKVSIGLSNSDTSKWMSPLKMFEYMSSKRPIVSSDLPVIREVLENNRNAILVAPEIFQEWREAINRLYQSSKLREDLATNAHSDYLSFYTWDVRAEALIRYATRNNNFNS